MPFQKGDPNNPGKKRAKKAQQEFVEVEPTEPSAPEWDEIVPKAPEKPKPETKEGAIPQLDTEGDLDFGGVHGWNLTELEFTDPSLTLAPLPPKCIREYCNSHDLIWRWISYPGAKHLGMRGYVALSVNKDMRKRIKAGDCPPTVDIDVTNKLVWREDAFLAVIPKRLYEVRLASKRRRTVELTRAARAAPGGLREMAERAGGKIVEYQVEETSRSGL